MTYTVRFAPSPTGYIHIGNARTALINWIVAQQSGGKFVLRFDDTDPERSRQDYADATEEDLKWLGIQPDVIVTQSSRAGQHQATADKLKADGLLYACYETPDELDRQRARRRARGLPPVYDRRALNYSREDLAQFEAEGRKAHWRFLLPNYADDPVEIQRTEVTWDDGCRGTQTVDIGSMSDPVLIRGDGSFPYTLPSVTDDIELGINYVIRGDDHVTNTAAQIVIFKALGVEPPAFAHHNLLTTADGEGLSKRKGALSLQSLRQSGLEAGSVASLAVLTGTSQAIEPCETLSQIADRFQLGTVSKSPARFDPADLDILNGKLLSDLNFSSVQERLEVMDPDAAEDFWLAVRGNLTKLDDAADWWSLITQETKFDLAPEDADFLAVATNHLPPEPWDQTTWKNWTGTLKEETGRKGKALFLPLRLALTGRSDGPELAKLLPLIGYKRTLDRLS